MAKAVFKKGDKIRVGSGARGTLPPSFGLVLSSREVLLLSGRTDRRPGERWMTLRMPIPGHAEMLQETDGSIPFEVDFALDVAKAAIS